MEGEDKVCIRGKLGVTTTIISVICVSKVRIQIARMDYFHYQDPQSTSFSHSYPLGSASDTARQQIFELSLLEPLGEGRRPQAAPGACRLVPPIRPVLFTIVCGLFFGPCKYKYAPAKLVKESLLTFLSGLFVKQLRLESQNSGPLGHSPGRSR
jgi:hypothetical protein